MPPFPPCFQRTAFSESSAGYEPRQEQKEKRKTEEAEQVAHWPAMGGEIPPWLENELVEAMKFAMGVQELKLADRVREIDAREQQLADWVREIEAREQKLADRERLLGKSSAEQKEKIKTEEAERVRDAIVALQAAEASSGDVVFAEAAAKLQTFAEAGRGGHAHGERLAPGGAASVDRQSPGVGPRAIFGGGVAGVGSRTTVNGRRQAVALLGHRARARAGTGGGHGQGQELPQTHLAPQ
jgi:hypothetical protein